MSLPTSPSPHKYTCTCTACCNWAVVVSSFVGTFPNPRWPSSLTLHSQLLTDVRLAGLPVKQS